MARLSLASRPLKTEILPAFLLPFATRQSPRARSRKLARKLLFTLIDMFLCGETPGKTFRRAETPLAENLSASRYLSKICIFVLKFKCLKPFRG
jgi:hypothetical protein